MSPTPSAAESTDRTAGARELQPTRIPAVETSRTTSGIGPLLPDADGRVIVPADVAIRLHIVDVALGAVDTVRVFADGSRGRPSAIQMVGDHVILDTNNSTVVMVRDDRPRPVVLARNHHLVATSDTSSVWVHNGGLGGLSGVATRLGLDGAVLDQIALPALARPLVGTRDGLLVGTAGTIIEVDGGGSHREIAHGLALASDGRR